MIAAISLLVNDYDEAIDFYCNRLQFELLEDTQLSATKRWVRVRPKNATGTCILLAKAANEKQQQQVGDQCGGRVFLFLHTDNFDRDYNDFKNKGVAFVREPVKEIYGTVAVFKDLYGNQWDLIEPR